VVDRALKAGHALGIARQAGRQNFDRHVAPQPGVGGAVHFAHAALAELGCNAVMSYGLRRH
jgi:hypothetical protein